jgi:hypothetical protein
MNNIQLFRTEKDDLANYSIWYSLRNWHNQGLKEFLDDAYNSYKLGEILYDEKYSKLSRTIKKDIFLTSFNAIFKSLNKAGTYDNLIEIIRAVFGQDAQITFTEPAPAQLNVNIVQNASDLVDWVSSDDDEIVTEDDDNIAFVALVRQIYLDEIINLFRQILIPSGIYFTISITHV